MYEFYKGTHSPYILYKKSYNLLWTCLLEDIVIESEME